MAIAKAEEGYMSDLRSQLRENKVRYKTITRNKAGGLLIRFKDDNERDSGLSLIEDNFLDLDVKVPDVSSSESQLVTWWARP